VDELVVKVVTFTRALTNASENGIAAVRLSDVVDQFLNKNRLADASATEQADLTALGIGRQEVENLNAGDQDFRFRRLLDIFRSRLVNAAGLRCVDWTSFINRLTNHVDDTAEHFRTDRNADRRARIGDRLTTHQTVGRVHRDTTYRVLTEVLSNLKNQAVSLVVGLKRVQDRRQIVLELNVHHRANNLTDGSNSAIGHDHLVGYLGGATAGRLGRCRSACRCFSHSLYLFDPLERFRARNDFDQFLGNLGLTLTVVGDGQLVDHLTRIARRIVHGAHLRAHLTSRIFKQCAENLDRDIPRNQVLQDRTCIRLVVVNRTGVSNLHLWRRGRNDLLGCRDLADD